MMQITCRCGEVPSRSDFGSDIWELEFNQLIKIHKWEEIVRKSLIKTISKYEKRLSNLKVNVKLTETEEDVDSKNYSRVKRKADIYISGTLANKSELFEFNTSVYVSPLSQ